LSLAALALMPDADLQDTAALISCDDVYCDVPHEALVRRRKRPRKVP
jgi:hypothetical protein